MTGDFMKFFMNTQKTKHLRSNIFEEDSFRNFTEIDIELIKILRDYDSHRYLGRLLSISHSNRTSIEFQNHLTRQVRIARKARPATSAKKTEY